MALADFFSGKNILKGLKILGTLLLSGAVITVTIKSCNNNKFTLINNNYKDAAEYPIKSDSIQGSIIILGQFDSWKKGNWDTIETNQPIGAVIPSKLNQDGLAKCKVIIAVGTASHEIEKDEEGENNRAYRRGFNILKELNPKIPSNVDLYILNLGRYIAKDVDTSSFMQRRVIVIGITEMRQGVNLEKVILAQLKAQESNTKLFIDSYSDSTLSIPTNRGLLK